MQKNSTTFLWLIVIGAVSIIEAAPDGSAVIHSYENALPPAPPKRFLPRAASLKTDVGRGAARLVRGAKKKAQTLRPKGGSLSLEKLKIAEVVEAESPESSIPTQPLCSSGLFYANIPSGEESPYQALQDLDRAPSPYGQWIFPSEQPSMETQQRHSSPPDDTLHKQLCTALCNSNQKTATQLIMNGADPDTQEYFSGNTILHIAALQGKYDYVRTLFESGYRPNPNVKNNQGQTVLHILASSKDQTATRATRSFLSREDGRTPADMYTTDAFGQTPLECAVQAENRKMIYLLLKRTQPGHQSIERAYAKARNHKNIVSIFEKNLTESPPKESAYLMLHDLDAQGCSDPSPYANIPDEVQIANTEQLRHALNIGEIDGARQLIAAGADPNERSESERRTA